MTAPTAPVRIFLAEDNDGDVFLVCRALRKNNVPYQLILVRNGAEAFELLELTASNSGSRPDIFLLDLNLPKLDGAQLLTKIRQTETLRHTPVLILTSSDSPRDRNHVFELGADLYFRKPTDLTAFMDLGRIISEAVEKSRQAL